jgi:hypothetical protein
MEYTVNDPLPGRLFAVFRVAMGSYLAVHFMLLLPWAVELFSDAGVMRDAALNPALGLFAVPARWLGSPAAATALVAALFGLSLLFCAGLFRRTAALLLWAGWAYLLARNNLILNPGIPYVGLLLLLSALVPPGEPWSIRLRGRAADPWRMPAMIPVVAWVALAAGYAFSGYTKLVSPHWADGTALQLMLDNPLARGTIADVSQAVPAWVCRLLTWSVIAAELAFLPMAAHARTRTIAWLGMTVMHIGVLATIGFADLTFGMLVTHLFVVEPRWVRGMAALAHRRATQPA